MALTLTAAAAASGLAATPAWAASGYHITATIGVGVYPFGVAVSPDCTLAYVANAGSGSVSVIGAATNQVIATIHGFDSSVAVAVGHGGTHIYVTNELRGTVSVVTPQ